MRPETIVENADREIDDKDVRRGRLVSSDQAHHGGVHYINEQPVPCGLGAILTVDENRNADELGVRQGDRSAARSPLRISEAIAVA